MSHALVTTKLHVPRTRPNLVERPRLYEALDRGERHALTLVSAPAGFGKTTLLVEWLMERSGDGKSVVWVSLDESDNDPARFLTYLVTALGHVEEGIGEGVLASLRSPELPPVEFFLRAARDRAVSLTIWEDGGAVEALESSPSYLQEARELVEGDLLAGEPSVEILEVEGGDLRPEALVGTLARTKRSGSSRSPAAGSRDDE